MQTARLLSRTFIKNHPLEAARFLDQVPPNTAASLLADAEPALAAPALQLMNVASGAECLVRLKPEKGAALAVALPVDSAALLLRRLPEKERESLITVMPTGSAEAVRRLLSFPEETAAALMDPNVAAFPMELDAGETLRRLRRAPRSLRYYIYVVDPKQALVGVISIRELMLSPTTAPLSSIMLAKVSYLRAHAGPQEIISHPGWQEFHALPVQDNAGRLVGVVRHETVRKLEEVARHERRSQGAINLFVPFAELYWQGLFHLLSTLLDRPRKPLEQVDKS